MSKKGKVLVAMSGGVDSAVAAAILVKEGYEVVGGFMKNWTCEVTGECDWRDERRDAMRVASHLDIPLMTYDFEKEYREHVVDYMIREYEAGRTPNPDVMCNKFIKFDLFLKEADKLGCDFMATGHYTQVKKEKDGYHMYKGVDDNKDQSYFLWTLNQDQLKRTLFPVGGYKKKMLREAAKKRGLPVADKKDSQGICFIGQVDLSEFLSRKIQPKPGKIVNADGDELGDHQGIHNYTIGQRHGFGDGLKQNDEYYIVDKRFETNELVVAKGKDHPMLFRERLEASEINWTVSPPISPTECKAKIRYRQPDQQCTVRIMDEDKVQVDFLINPNVPSRQGNQLFFIKEMS